MLRSSQQLCFARSVGLDGNVEAAKTLPEYDKTYIGGYRFLFLSTGTLSLCLQFFIWDRCYLNLTIFADSCIIANDHASRFYRTSSVLQMQTFSHTHNWKCLMMIPIQEKVRKCRQHQGSPHRRTFNTENNLHVTTHMYRCTYVQQRQAHLRRSIAV